MEMEELNANKTNKSAEACYPFHVLLSLYCIIDLSSHGDAPGTFFKHSHGKPLTKSVFIWEIQSVWVCQPTNLPATASGSAKPRQQPRLD